MKAFFGLALAAVTSLVGTTAAAPLVAHPGTVQDLIITANNTVNATVNAPAAVTTDGEALTVSIYNNYEGTTTLNAYVSGLDSNGAVIMLSSSGSWYYPTNSGSTTPVLITADIAIPMNAYGETTTITLPSYVSSGRIWVAVGELQFFTVIAATGAVSLVEPSFANPSDPSAGVKWGFFELTNNDGGIYANLSFVDFIGLVMGVTLTLGDGSTQTAKGLAAGSLQNICNDLNAQSAVDGQAWGEMCVTDSSGNALRVLSPNIYNSVYPSTMVDYYTDYIDQVWTKYTTEVLTIDTQSSYGEVACQVTNDELVCAGDELPYARPAIEDIWGCNSGPFANQGSTLHLLNVARICAGLVRSTLLLDGGDVQPSLPSTDYYTVSPTNHYSRIVHNYETDGLGYAFSYDDVNPTGENAAGVVAGANPALLEIFVGGFV
ncbi:hypothetical protein BX600DRAFT_420334 [Xylariales sp. PMI_506]|nr:hypothetical protein BX600DRAFT_420334 [Xylariales sp. PMI_506]